MNNYSQIIFFISRDGGFAQTIFVLLKIGRIAFFPHNYCKALTVGNMLSLCNTSHKAKITRTIIGVDIANRLLTLFTYTATFCKGKFFYNLTSSYPDSAHSTKTCHASGNLRSGVIFASLAREGKNNNRPLIYVI